MKLVIRSGVLNTRFEIEVGDETTVAQIKQAVQTRIRLPNCLQDIIYTTNAGSSSALADSQKVSLLGLKSGASLELSVKLSQDEQRKKQYNQNPIQELNDKIRFWSIVSTSNKSFDPFASKPSITILGGFFKFSEAWRQYLISRNLNPDGGLYLVCGAISIQEQMKIEKQIEEGERILRFHQTPLLAVPMHIVDAEPVIIPNSRCIRSKMYGEARDLVNYRISAMAATAKVAELRFSAYLGFIIRELRDNYNPESPDALLLDLKTTIEACKAGIPADGRQPLVTQTLLTFLYETRNVTADELPHAQSYVVKILELIRDDKTFREEICDVDKVADEAVNKVVAARLNQHAEELMRAEKPAFLNVVFRTLDKKIAKLGAQGKSSWFFNKELSTQKVSSLQHLEMRLADVQGREDAVGILRDYLQFEPLLQQYRYTRFWKPAKTDTQKLIEAAIRKLEPKGLGSSSSQASSCSNLSVPRKP